MHVLTADSWDFSDLGEFCPTDLGFYYDCMGTLSSSALFSSTLELVVSFFDWKKLFFRQLLPRCIINNHNYTVQY